MYKIITLLKKTRFPRMTGRPGVPVAWRVWLLAVLFSALSGVTYSGQMIFNVATSLNPAGYKASVYFSASLPADATGSVTFLTNGTPLCTSNLAGGLATSLTTANLPRGTNIITAQYPGDGNYSGSTNVLAGGQIVTNHPPTAGSAVYNRTVGSIKIYTSDLFSNFCSDVDGDALTLPGTGVSTNGVSILATQSFLGYVNTNNVNDHFVYIISDGHGSIATNIIYVNFTPFITGQNGTASRTIQAAGAGRFAKTRLGAD